jgi:AsmA protein
LNLPTKRLGFAGLAVLLLGLCAVALAPFLIPADAARRAVTDQIRLLTGHDPEIRGAVSVALPSAAVTLHDVTLSDSASRPLLTADALVAHLRVLPLLAGRIEIAAITLQHPQISVTAGSDGSSNWSPLIESLRLALAPKSARQGSVSFSEVRIEDGSLQVEDRDNGIRETIDDIAIDLAWPAISKGFAATGHFTWRDEPMQAGLSIANLLAALSGQQTGMKIRLSGTPLKLAFDGNFSAQPTGKAEGMLSADGSSLRSVLDWFGKGPGTIGGFGPFALKAHAAFGNGVIALTGVNAELDGNTAEGVLSYAIADRGALQGTLAVDTLNVTPYLSDIQLLNSSRLWDAHHFDFNAARRLDIDLRLSAARVRIGATRFGRSAVAINARDNQLIVTVGESQAFGGLVRGGFTLSSSEAGAEIKSQMQFTDVDLYACLGELVGLRRIQGKGDLSFNVESFGSSIDELARSIGGNASLISTQGALAGINVEQLLKRLERRPLSGVGDFRTGRTPYDSMKLAVKINRGVVDVQDLNISGTTIRLDGAGRFSIPTREFNVKGAASLVDAGGTSSFELPFMLQGPWDDPVLLPDPQILIQRSGAAAPLLNAFKDRKVRETVREAIGHLSGTHPAIPEPPPESPAASTTPPAPAAAYGDAPQAAPDRQQEPQQP